MPTRSRSKLGSIRTPRVEVSLSSGRGWLRFSCPYCGELLFHGWTQPSKQSEGVIEAHVKVCRLAERQSWVDQLLYHRGLLFSVLAQVEQVRRSKRPQWVAVWDLMLYHIYHTWRRLMTGYFIPYRRRKGAKARRPTGVPQPRTTDKQGGLGKTDLRTDPKTDPRHFCPDGTPHHWRLSSPYDANGACSGVCLKCKTESMFSGGVRGAYYRINEMEAERELVERGLAGEGLAGEELVVFRDGESLEELAEVEQGIEASRERGGSA